MPERFSNLKPDEDVECYPTFACRKKGDKDWLLTIRGRAFEPEEDSAKRALFLGMLRRAMDLEKGDAESRILNARIRRFLVDNERGKTVVFRFGEGALEAEKTGANGHFRLVQPVEPKEAEALLQGGGKNGWVSFDVSLPKGDKRSFTAQVQFISSEGWSVISDIDDTIKISHVRKKKTLLRKTFLEEFEAVPGMSEFYERCVANGAAFHYVSGSPWQLFAPLREFIGKAGFPLGTFHLKQFRLTDKSVLNLVGSQEGHKQAAITPILEAFPSRRFLLIGDSGEQDPEIYGALARAHPKQVVGILIRDVSGESADHERYQKAFEGTDAKKWMVFSDARALPDKLDSWLGNLKPAGASDRK